MIDEAPSIQVLKCFFETSRCGSENGDVVAVSDGCNEKTNHLYLAAQGLHSALDTVAHRLIVHIEHLGNVCHRHSLHEAQIDYLLLSGGQCLQSFGQLVAAAQLMIVSVVEGCFVGVAIDAEKQFAVVVHQTVARTHDGGLQIVTEGGKQICLEIVDLRQTVVIPYRAVLKIN